jgi:hypothetical protein
MIVVVVGHGSRISATRLRCRDRRAQRFRHFLEPFLAGPAGKSGRVELPI